MTASAVYNAGHDHGRLNTTDAGISSAPRLRLETCGASTCNHTDGVFNALYCTLLTIMFERLLVCAESAGARAKVSGVYTFDDLRH